MQSEVRPVPYGKNTTPPGQAAMRRLAAVVAGEIADYSRLIGVEEEAIVVRLTQIQREIVEPTRRRPQ